MTPAEKELLEHVLQYDPDAVGWEPALEVLLAKVKLERVSDMDRERARAVITRYYFARKDLDAERRRFVDAVSRQAWDQFCSEVYDKCDAG